MLLWSDPEICAREYCPLKDSRGFSAYFLSCFDIKLSDFGFHICNSIPNWYEVWRNSKMFSSLMNRPFFRGLLPVKQIKHYELWVHLVIGYFLELFFFGYSFFFRFVCNFQSNIKLVFSSIFSQTSLDIPLLIIKSVKCYSVYKTSRARQIPRICSHRQDGLV